MLPTGQLYPDLIAGTSTSGRYGIPKFGPFSSEAAREIPVPGLYVPGYVPPVQPAAPQPTPATSVPLKSRRCCCLPRLCCPSLGLVGRATLGSFVQLALWSHIPHYLLGAASKEYLVATIGSLFFPGVIV